ncbi:MAG: DUF6507 family protein [Pseudonocardiaceae bacterium]
MSRWDISPAGVRGVLTQTQAVAGEFEGHMASMNSAMEGGAAEASSEPIATALTGWVDAKRPSIEFIFTRAAASVNGAAQATNAYLQGDLEMAANAQASVTAAPDPRATMPGGGGQVPR